MLQTVIWILALVILVLFLRRRRSRRAQQRWFRAAERGRALPRRADF